MKTSERTADPMESSAKRPLWIATGGTVSCIQGERGLVPAASPEQMERIKDELCLDCRLLCLMNTDSANNSVEIMDTLAQTVYDELKKNTCSRIVITHGTDTLAFTAAYLDSAVKGADIPVVTVGSQLPYGTPGSDAPENLRTAFNCELGAGFYVVSYDRVYSAGSAYKADSRDERAFEGLYAEGGAQAGELVLYRPKYPRVGVLWLTPFTVPEDVKAFESYDAAVICAYGTGTVPERLLPALRELSAGVRTAVVSQCRRGGIRRDVYATSLPKDLNIPDSSGISLEKAAAMLALFGSL